MRKNPISSRNRISSTFEICSHSQRSKGNAFRDALASLRDVEISIVPNLIPPPSTLSIWFCRVVGVQSEALFES
jgi:hypothetical protein